LYKSNLAYIARFFLFILGVNILNMKKRIRNLTEMQKFAEDFVKKINLDVGRLSNKTKATIVGLYGDLGSGKTAFTKEVSRAFGLKQTVTSPTFVIEKIYKLPQFGSKASEFEYLIHIDAYRLESGEELKQLGWEEIVNNPKNLIFIEWPENIKDILPKDIKKMKFKFIDEDTREVS